MADLWIEVDLDAVIHNYREIRSVLAPDCAVMAVVKADAYGLGAVEVAKALEEEGCKDFAVTTIAEALILRQEGIRGRILVLGPSSSEDWAEAITEGIELTVSQLPWLADLEEIAVQIGRQAMIQLKLETGLGRTGFTGDQLQELASALRSTSHLGVVGAYTHLARGAQRDNAYTRKQAETYLDYIRKLEEMGVAIPLKHICNSAALLDFPEYHFQMVRTGTLLGGHFPSRDWDGKLQLKDPWQAKARILHLQKVAKGTYVGYQSLYRSKTETTLAVIPVGYADGFGLEPKFVPQGLLDLAKIIVKNFAVLFGFQLGREKMLINGHSVRVAGKIGMQLTVLDLGQMECHLGDEVSVPLRRTQANPRISRIYIKNGDILRKRILQEGFVSVYVEYSNL